MSLALVITLQKELPDASALYSKAKTGKALARESDRLSTAARRCNVPGLSTMLSESQAALIAQLLADGFDPAKMRIPPEQWFAASEGLKSVRGLAAQVAANLNDFKQPNPILRDLKAAEALLIAAETAGIAFHFSNADL
jgi:glycine/D-amino acid oxidase-like deaminating enzyme